MKIKAIVVGRHAGEIPGVEILRTENVTFPATSGECGPIIQSLVAQALQEYATLIFQNTPGQVAAALVKMTAFYGHAPRVGIVINKPGERLSGVEEKVSFETEGDAEAAAAAIRFANPRARISIEGSAVTVTVDPPMEFEHSHIEWL